MDARSRGIEERYERYYAAREAARVYPTEFVVRTFLARYPRLKFRKPAAGARVLDVGFGDGRNTVFLCEQGFEVSGIEISAAIVGQTARRLDALGLRADLRVGRNSRIPFEDSRFDAILACHCCYYLDAGETFADNMAEYARVLKRGGHLVASIACRSSFIFRGAEEMPDGSLVVREDPYGVRHGCRLQAFSRTEEIEAVLAPWFTEFSFGFADNDYYGIAERVFWTVCRKS